jgi:hypothetical protein
MYQLGDVVRLCDFTGYGYCGHVTWLCLEPTCDTAAITYRPAEGAPWLLVSLEHDGKVYWNQVYGREHRARLEELQFLE